MSTKQQPIRSMTGYAQVRHQLPAGELALSVKSLNHRGLDIRFHLAPEFEPFENSMRSRIPQRVTRGHVDVRVNWTRPQGAAAAGLNKPLFEAYLNAFRQASAEYGINAVPDISSAFRIPGMLVEPVEDALDEKFGNLLLEALDEGLDALVAFREREGAQLAADIAKRCGNVTSAATRMEEIRDRALPAFQARLTDRITDLLGGSNMEPQRLVQEAAMLADRSDIGEEISRLRIHAGQLSSLLDSGGEVGKRIDFLLQEMHREANTILSKTTGIGETGLEITDLAIASKSDIEKMREQALNLE